MTKFKIPFPPGYAKENVFVLSAHVGSSGRAIFFGISDNPHRVIQYTTWNRRFEVIECDENELEGNPYFRKTKTNCTTCGN